MVIVHHSPPPRRPSPIKTFLTEILCGVAALSFLLCEDLIITFQAFTFGQALSSVSTDTKVKVKA